MGQDYYDQLVEWAIYHEIHDRCYIITDKSSDVIQAVTYYYNGAIGAYPYGSVIIMDTGSNNDYGIGAKRNLCVRMAMGNYCVMIDDNLDIVDYRAEVTVSKSIDVVLGPGNKEKRIPMTVEEKEGWVEYGGHITYRSLTDSIIDDPKWEEDGDMVIAGVLRHDHVTGILRIKRIGTVTKSWKIYKYAVIDTTRLGHINYDPNLTVLGEDVLLYTRLQAADKTGYIFNTALAYRPDRPDTLIPGKEGTSALINADYFINTYMSTPSLQPADIIAFLAGAGRSMVYNGSFVIGYQNRRRTLMNGTRIDPYIIATAITGVPIISDSRPITASGINWEADDMWNRYTACRNPTHVDNMEIIRPQGSLAYTICPPSIMITDGDKYDHIWRFLLLYGMVVDTGDVSLLRSLFMYLYDPSLPIAFDRAAGHTNVIANLEHGHDDRDCRPFDSSRCPTPRRGRGVGPLPPRRRRRM